jgi:uracil-DNA glycosylase
MAARLLSGIELNRIGRAMRERRRIAQSYKKAPAAFCVFKAGAVEFTVRTRTSNVVGPRVEADQGLDSLLAEVRVCRACETHLPLGPRPVLQAGAAARILIVGQAPGARAHASGVPWDDRSGERLRAWMNVDAKVFYDESRIAILPMAYCYPGRAASGDRPPRRECASLWLDRLLNHMPSIELTLLVGRYAQAHFLGSAGNASLTATMKAWRVHAPRIIPLPHPSPRNIAWFIANPWFDGELLPVLRRSVSELLGT